MFSIHHPIIRLNIEVVALVKYTSTAVRVPLLQIICTVGVGYSKTIPHGTRGVGSVKINRTMVKRYTEEFDEGGIALCSRTIRTYCGDRLHSVRFGSFYYITINTALVPHSSGSVADR